MYSDTSCTHAGSALWQIQDGKPCLLGYASKTLPAASKNYSVTELEMTGMLINLHSWRNYIHIIEIDVAIDHKAVVQIMKAKHPPRTDRVSVLLGKLLDKPFDLYYVKGKDLILADFLSRIKTDKSDPGEVIPISFINKQNAENKSHYIFNAGWVTSLAVKREGLSMPTIHGHNKQLDPHRKPEHQVGLDPTPLPQTPPDRSSQTPSRDKHRTHSLPVSVYKPTTTVTTSQQLIKKSIKTLSKEPKYPNTNPPMSPSQVPIVP